ncbi:putative low-complexity protein [Nostoc sp. PCC 7524]|uniref:pentapeptide repeat-containing protein n=1 Tax=Nostoc sp. (strain ATCC 29411 / PCC 7524) TaxID=28072 RepID=UPI00029EEB19|nr:pentapeptide repeat-containing protein [Nostoc sp. PCC 7524]AFY48461.1 putative low-complexity protein [Nostoc sp. PCC 7524]
MFTEIFNFYQSVTKEIKNNQHTLTDIFPKKYFSSVSLTNNFHYVFKQQVQLAIEYWHNQQLEKWLETIFYLEKLVQDYPQYQGRIIEFLCDFVRNNAPYISQVASDNRSTLPIRTEIQTVLTIIAKTDRHKDSETEQLNLSHTDMRGANLQGANLELTNLYHVNLAGANLSQANLSGAILSAANLLGANLSGANLSGAILSAANLSKANLAGANLRRANLYLAHLHWAIIDDAIFDDANLREAQFVVIDTTNSNT